MQRLNNPILEKLYEIITANSIGHNVITSEEDIHFLTTMLKNNGEGLKRTTEQIAGVLGEFKNKFPEYKTGVSIDTPIVQANKTTTTLLQHAIYCGNARIVQLLIDSGASMDSIDKNLLYHYLNKSRFNWSVVFVLLKNMTPKDINMPVPLIRGGTTLLHPLLLGSILTIFDRGVVALDRHSQYEIMPPPIEVTNLILEAKPNDINQLGEILQDPRTDKSLSFPVSPLEIIAINAVGYLKKIDDPEDKQRYLIKCLDTTHLLLQHGATIRQEQLQLFIDFFHAGQVCRVPETKVANIVWYGISEQVKRFRETEQTRQFLTDLNPSVIRYQSRTIAHVQTVYCSQAVEGISNLVGQYLFFNAPHVRVSDAPPLLADYSATIPSSRTEKVARVLSI